MSRGRGVHFLGVACLWGGATLVLAGVGVVAAALLKLGASSALGAALLGAGVVLAVLGTSLPVRRRAACAPATALDDVLATWHFEERHEIGVGAPAETTAEAVRSVTAREIRLFRLLTAIRRLGRPSEEGILAPPPDEPVLEVATRTGFQLLAGEDGGELVVGRAVLVPPGAPPPLRRTARWYREVADPGYALAAMSFRVEPAADGSRVVTETRIRATDPRAQRRFGVYWRLIYPGSALIRRTWLRAIRARAERASGGAAQG